MLSAVERLAMRMEEAPPPVLQHSALYLPEYIRGQPVLIATEEIGAFFLTNARLGSQGIGVQCRNSTSMEDRAERIIAWGTRLYGVLASGWLRLDPARMPQSTAGPAPAPAVVENAAAATQLTASFSSLEEWTETTIMQKLHMSEVPELSGASVTDVRGVSKGLALDRPFWHHSLADMTFPLVLTLTTKPSSQPLRIDEHDRCLWHLAQRLDRQERALLDVDGGRIQSLVSQLERQEAELSEMRRAHVAAVALLQQQDRELSDLRGVSSMASEGAVQARAELERQERQLADLRRQQSLDLSDAAAAASGLRAQVMERLDWLNEVILVQQQSIKAQRRAGHQGAAGRRAHGVAAGAAARHALRDPGAGAAADAGGPYDRRPGAAGAAGRGAGALALGPGRSAYGADGDG